jgi:hypothetical protein
MDASVRDAKTLRVGLVGLHASIGPCILLISDRMNLHRCGRCFGRLSGDDFKGLSSTLQNGMLFCGSFHDSFSLQTI